MLLVCEILSSPVSLSCVVECFLTGGIGGLSVEQDFSMTLFVIPVKLSEVVVGVDSSYTICRSALVATGFSIETYL